MMPKHLPQTNHERDNLHKWMGDDLGDPQLMVPHWSRQAKKSVMSVNKLSSGNNEMWQRDKEDGWTRQGHSTLVNSVNKTW